MLAQLAIFRRATFCSSINLSANTLSYLSLTTFSVKSLLKYGQVLVLCDVSGTELLKLGNVHYRRPR